MALDDVKNLNRTRFWYYSYFISFYLLATGVGMLSRLYLPELGDLDAELALPTMALELLPDFFVGMVLAGIFAATMSTGRFTGPELFGCRDATIWHRRGWKKAGR